MIRQRLPANYQYLKNINENNQLEVKYWRKNWKGSTGAHKQMHLKAKKI